MDFNFYCEALFAEVVDAAPRIPCNDSTEDVNTMISHKRCALTELPLSLRSREAGEAIPCLSGKGVMIKKMGNYAA